MGQQRRVLHLVYLRFWSAIAWHAMGLAEAMMKQGHRCWIGGAEGSPIMLKAEARAEFTGCLLNLSWLRPWNYLAVAAKLRRWLADEAIDLVYVHTGSGHLETHLSRIGLPVGIVRVRADARAPRLDLGKRWLYRYGTDLMAVSGSYMIDGLLAGGLPEERIVHLAPGIDSAGISENKDFRKESARAAICTRYGLSGDRPLIGIIGRLSPVKGHRVLIEAAGSLAKAGLDFDLLVIGAEKEVAPTQLMAWATEAGVADRLLLTGHVADPLVHAAALDIGVISSLGSEAVSRSALEFMAVGTPVISSQVGILPEVIGDDNRLVPPGDAAALAKALLVLLRDKAANSQAAESGFRRIERIYSYEALGARAGQITEAAIEHRAQSGRGRAKR